MRKKVYKKLKPDLLHCFLISLLKAKQECLEAQKYWEFLHVQLYHWTDKTDA